MLMMLSDVSECVRGNQIENKKEGNHQGQTRKKICQRAHRESKQERGAGGPRPLPFLFLAQNSSQNY